MDRVWTMNEGQITRAMDDRPPRIINVMEFAREGDDQLSEVAARRVAMVGGLGIAPQNVQDHLWPDPGHEALQADNRHTGIRATNRGMRSRPVVHRQDMISEPGEISTFTQSLDATDGLALDGLLVQPQKDDRRSLIQTMKGRWTFHAVPPGSL